MLRPFFTELDEDNNQDKAGVLILGKVLVVVGVEDGLIRAADSRILSTGLTVDVVVGSTIDGEVGRLVDQRSSLGIGAGVGGAPESAAEVNPSEFFGD